MFWKYSFIQVTLKFHLLASISGLKVLKQKRIHFKASVVHLDVLKRYFLRSEKQIPYLNSALNPV